MREQTIKIYGIDELSEEAKEKAHEEYLTNGMFEYHWLEENIESIRSFSDLFGVKVKEYQIGTSCQSFVVTDADQDSFRGVRPDDMPSNSCPLTGYYLDDTLLLAFYTYAKSHDGDVKGAFDAAIDAAIKDIVADMEYQESFEYFKDYAFDNELEFLEDGEVYR